MSKLQRSDESRQIVLRGVQQDYRLKRSVQRRTLALSIGDGGLVVHAPWALPLYQVEQFVLDKAVWVTEKLASQSALALSQPDWQDGMNLLYCGRQITLKVSADVHAIELYDGELRVPLRAKADLQRFVVAWYQQMALAYFNARMLQFSVKLSRQPHQLKLSNARCRWGSCTRNGVVRLNWRLIQATGAEIDYVLAHELAHLTQMNHAPVFWQELARLYPDYHVPRNTLRTQGRRYQRISL